VILRPLRAGEMPALRALHDASFAALGTAYDDAAKAAHAALVAEPAYEAEVLRCDIWVAQAPDGRLLGSAGWNEQDGRCRIRKVFIHPGAARQGLATRLVQAARRAPATRASCCAPISTPCRFTKGWATRRPSPSACPCPAASPCPSSS